MLRSLVQLFQRRHLRLREARVAVGTLAEHRLGLEGALAGVFDQIVGESVGRIAGRNGCRMDGGQLRCWYRSAGNAERLSVPNTSGIRMRLIVPRSSDHVPVVVLRIALGLHQRLPSAVRTGTEIRMSGR